MTATTPKTVSIRVSAQVGEMLEELTCLRRATVVGTVDRLLTRALERELVTARKDELDRLSSLAAGK